MYLSFLTKTICIVQRFRSGDLFEVLSMEAQENEKVIGICENVRKKRYK